MPFISGVAADITSGLHRKLKSINFGIFERDYLSFHVESICAWAPEPVFMPSLRHDDVTLAL